MAVGPPAVTEVPGGRATRASITTAALSRHTSNVVSREQSQGQSDGFCWTLPQTDGFFYVSSGKPPN